ncbi:MAG TPA: hypothetical protein DHN29_02205, partial [Cytophagales bacterium]|nr:hypothetical protein [Cytophagales bacterium]
MVSGTSNEKNKALITLQKHVEWIMQQEFDVLALSGDNCEKAWDSHFQVLRNTNIDPDVVIDPEAAGVYEPLIQFCKDNNKVFLPMPGNHDINKQTFHEPRTWHYDRHNSYFPPSELGNLTIWREDLPEYNYAIVNGWFVGSLPFDPDASRAKNMNQDPALNKSGSEWMLREIERHGLPVIIVTHALLGPPSEQQPDGTWKHVGGLGYEPHLDMTHDSSGKSNQDAVSWYNDFLAKIPFSTVVITSHRGSAYRDDQTAENSWCHSIQTGLTSQAYAGAVCEYNFVGDKVIMQEWNTYTGELFDLKKEYWTTPNVNIFKDDYTIEFQRWDH